MLHIVRHAVVGKACNDWIGMQGTVRHLMVG